MQVFKILLKVDTHFTKKLITEHMETQIKKNVVHRGSEIYKN